MIKYNYSQLDWDIMIEVHICMTMSPEIFTKENESSDMSQNKHKKVKH